MSAYQYLINMKLLLSYLDMKLEVLVHAIDVVEDVLHNPWDDTLHVVVPDDSLKHKFIHR